MEEKCAHCGCKASSHVMANGACQAPGCRCPMFGGSTTWKKPTVVGTAHDLVLEGLRKQLNSMTEEERYGMPIRQSSK